MRASTTFAAFTALLLLGSASAAFAQDEDRPREKDPVRELGKSVDKRMDRLEKQIREMRQIIVQARSTGQPVDVRIATDPDPAVLALTPRLDDLEQSARTLNSQVETLTHDLDTARRAAADAKDQVRTLNERLDKLDTRLQIVEGIQRGVAAANGPPPMVQAPPPPQQQQQEEPQAEAAQGAPDPAQSYATGRKLFIAGDYSGSAAAFQAFIEQSGDSAQGPQARYWLGESFFRQNDFSDAATAFIGAVRGWPKTTWAPDAVVKLARALQAMNRPKDACGTLDELNRRYPTISISVAAQAKDTRAKAQCPA
jgi:tol-pal system protein YbgF